MKKVIFFVVAALLGIFGTSRMVLAANSVLFISPAFLNSTVQKTFNVFVKVNPANHKVCVVKGTLSFNNFACQSISIASGLMAQITPTCANPSFTVSFPACTITTQNILLVSVKGEEAGLASITFMDVVKVIGEGAYIPSSIQGGAYNIDIDQISASTPTIGDKLFDITSNIESAVVYKSSDLITRTQFTSFGNVPTLVNMVYRIKDASGKEVFTEKDEVTVETEQLVTKDFNNLKIKSGKYTLVLATTYGDNIQDEFRQAFEVKGASNWIISIAIGTAIAIFGVYKFSKRQKNNPYN
jgi:hypothetical protein